MSPDLQHTAHSDSAMKNATPQNNDSQTHNIDTPHHANTETNNDFQHQIHKVTIMATHLDEEQHIGQLTAPVQCVAQSKDAKSS